MKTPKAKSERLKEEPGSPAKESSPVPAQPAQSIKGKTQPLAAQSESGCCEAKCHRKLWE